ncbi:amidohydrolase family protein [Neobacillus kokaensis]|uniref:Metal-dependent hydrolase n=1 Tax=Neobacillus kokaensis TaxID=2759023 RepID=A0ABQ3N452_9BACI|nr:amidohydrolase family protein [Neobacillus kokaensis]GHH98625.1 metal-dependent hydrolase [Neobacillus kokaensis]
MIIDYHSHIKWDRRNNHYFVNELMEDMEKNKIARRVVSALHGKGISKQNNFIANLVEEFPEKLIGCAVINPKEYDCVDEMRRICSMDCFKAIELDSLEHNYFPEECDALDEVFELAGKHNLVVNVFTGWGCRTMPAQWAYYAERHLNVKMVFLHMGTTDFGYGCVELVPKLENVYVETSCMYELPILRKAFSKINHDKFLFGSHYPHKITKCSIDTFDLLNLSETTLDKMYFQNSARLLDL